MTVVDVSKRCETLGAGNRSIQRNSEGCRMTRLPSNAVFVWFLLSCCCRSRGCSRCWTAGNPLGSSLAVVVTVAAAAKAITAVVTLARDCAWLSFKLVIKLSYLSLSWRAWIQRWRWIQLWPLFFDRGWWSYQCLAFTFVISRRWVWNLPLTLNRLQLSQSPPCIRINCFTITKLSVLWKSNNALFKTFAGFLPNSNSIKHTVLQTNIVSATP